MANSRRNTNNRALGIGGVVVLAALVLGLSALSLGNGADVPPNAGTVPRAELSDTSPEPAVIEASDRAVMIGDSYAQGVGATSAAKSFPSLLAERMGWELTNLARGGTGYITTSDVRGCGLDVCPNYRQMIPAILAAKPTYIVITGGRNDRPSDELTRQVQGFYRDLRAALPDAKIYATSPLTDEGAAPESFQDLARTIQEAAELNGATYLDLGQPLEGRPELIAKDGVHPNDDGHAAIATSIQPPAA
jgi:acyl-CoA thioesterase-1